MKTFNQSEFNADLEIAPWSILELFDDPSNKTKICDLLLTDVHAPLKKVKEAQCSMDHKGPTQEDDLS